jgi:hypothetical protein
LEDKGRHQGDGDHFLRKGTRVLTNQVFGQKNDFPYNMIREQLLFWSDDKEQLL